MPANQFSIVTVASGARSLRSLEHGETFHPVVGPMAEARALHVAQSRLVERAKAGALVVWDVGLGAAANALAVIEAFRGAENCAVELHSFDLTLAPLRFAAEHAEELGYLAPWKNEVASLLAHGTAESGVVRWFFHEGDFRVGAGAPAPDAILYDPYSPAANPGMWTLEHFTRLRARLARPCTLTSYSRSTAVRATLVLAGFFIGRGSATGEKNETTVAATHRDLLAAPLGEEWLQRAARSTRGGPLREGRDAGPATDDELARMRAMLNPASPAPAFA